ncbi:MAG: DUF502 domain-containing protein [Sedimentisphaerales bacterium]|nr:DUF502 domain-containing protein [Sedimentisphaerales bacterium]
MLKKIANYFVTGLLVFVPAAITITAIFWAVSIFDRLVGVYLYKLLGRYIPGLGLISVLALIFLIGFLASNFIGKKLFGLLDKLFTKIPIAKLLYSATKDFIKAFTGDHRSFDKPVLVELIKDGPKVMGFITKDSLEKLGIIDHVAVYLPQSYNFAGQTIIMPQDCVQPLNINPADAMKFIVSGGVSDS